MAAPNTQTVLDGEQNRSLTSVGLSTNIIIEVNGNPVGGVQSLTVNENRAIKMVQEVGTDGNVDSAPQSATKITGNCNRIRVNALRIAPAFGRGFLHAGAQRIPFDIKIKDLMNGSASDQTIITTIHNVWINSISYSYTQGDYIIAETMGWEAEAIWSTMGTSTNSAATSGIRGFTLQKDNAGIEASADTGNRRGALDAAGLLNAYFI
jgi:hypothetical protein